MKGCFIAATILLLSLPAFASGPGLGPTDYRGGINASWGGSSRSSSGTARVCTHSPNGNLNLRSEPRVSNNPPLERIPNGTIIDLYDGHYAEDNFWWWRTHYGRNWGWVRSDYVCGDPQ